MDCKMVNIIMIARKDTHLSLISVVFLFCIALLPIQLQAKPSVEALMAKGDSCRHIWQYNKALGFFQQAYDDPSVVGNPHLQMQLLERIMRTHYVLRHWKELPETSYQLYHLAKKHNAPTYVSMALFMRGKRFHMEGDKKEGYQTCQEAIDLMKNSDYKYKYHELAAYHAILTNMYMSDKRFDEALRTSEEQERYVRLAYKTKTNCERGLQRVYVPRMYLLAETGRYVEADSLYEIYGNMPVTDPLYGDALLNYFRLRGKTDASLAFLDVAMRNIRLDGDTLGRNMLRLITDKGDIYFQLGEYQKAAECYANMGRIADSISVNTLRRVSAEVYKVIDKEHAISRHRQILIITVATVLLLLTILVFIAYQGFVERRRNRSMMSTIQQLMHYRNLVIQNGDSVEMGENEDAKAAEDERQHYKEVDKRIMKEQLFAQPDFGRDELMRLFGVDKNTLPSIIQRYAGTNVPGYINNKRMEYAVLLIKQHPEYTLGAISEACGIKSPATFIRNFKNAYGMTPSEFRKQLDEYEITPPNINN